MLSDHRSSTQQSQYTTPNDSTVGSSSDQYQQQQQQKQYDNHYIYKKRDEKTAIEHQENVENDFLDPEEYNEKQGSRKRSLKHYLCCICCPCLPMWARYGCCALLILFVIFLIIVGVLAGIFKVPTVEFNGPTNHPAALAPFEKSDTSLAFSVNFGLQIGVINNNVESITFESIRAIAYYPTAPKVAVGGGEIYNVYIKSYGISNFTFPFSINYDPAKDEGYAMLSDVATKCGLLGGTAKEDLYIEYDLIPTVRIAGIAISPTIRQSSHFPCPITAGQLNVGLAINPGGNTYDSEDEDEEDEEDEEDP